MTIDENMIKLISKNEKELEREIELFLQPQYYYAGYNSFSLTGVECLLRFNKYEIDVEKFINIMSSKNRINLVTKIVFQKALKIARIFLQNNIEIKISINISSKDINSYFLRDYLKENINQINKEELKKIKFEITETSQLNINKFHTLQKEFEEYGLLFVIDDFGTGFNSFETIFSIENVDFIKLDKVFLKNKKNKKNILGSMHYIIKNLDREAIVEGVEDEKQLWELIEIGFIFFQGYFFSKPLSLNTFLDYYKKYKEIVV